MKFTHLLLDAVFCCLLALPISLAKQKRLDPYYESETGCQRDIQTFTCNPFGSNACGSIYMPPDQPKINVPREVAKDAYDVTRALFDEFAEEDTGKLFALPFKLVNNGKKPDDYEVDDAFVKEMGTNVQNYVAQDVSIAEMKNLYSGIVGNNAAFRDTATEFDNLKDNKDNDSIFKNLKNAIKIQKVFMIGQYPYYENAAPTINPAKTPSGTTTGANGWGIYYSVFVTQMLIAFIQDITVEGRLADSITSQQEIVIYGWKGMKHVKVLIDTYVAQREKYITGPTSVDDRITRLKSFEVKDDWVYYQGISTTPQTCSWDESNPYTYSVSKKSGPRPHNCDQSTGNFINAYSIHCMEGRKQFVTGSIINNWNTWLIEPSKQWAKLVDLICKRGDSDDETLQMLCNNQGVLSPKNKYNSNGGTAIDYINNNNNKEVESKNTIQQTCQDNYPGGNVIATPVQCKSNYCNNYYKSIQPEASKQTHFSDQCDAGLDEWTCCLDVSSWDPSGDDNGHTCQDGNNNECNNGLVCGRYDNSATSYQCCHCTNKDCLIQDETWCRNDKGGLCSDGNDNNCADGLVCGLIPHNSYATSYNSTYYNKYKCCDDYYLSNGIATCKEDSQQYEVTPKMLVGPLNETHRESNMPSWAMVGILGLAMVATYKLVNPHQDKYTELE
ncbi:hypothetical protein FRACYDRAFT_244382 [Fragilariopsis cylindrus CCMP1102]|uniref:Uncharacterized protein n=1 Tax=Fragilariopsis cylindrus CCMP1102 TaxID=635003 RepID=A0A1E7F1Q3_9STRA|nr:hypothetical protein FRACYDRAFT_244382 [Fragilariopsis cylindrus CCMP1102]|eukprot:OEU12122.1 hypothetical protein FRACYDRAFT_244382 [Fragilariopsis cylindrus CCMP1102]